MKRLLFLPLMLVVCLSSCKKAVDGECEPPAFENTVTFTSDGGTKTIVAKNDVQWWFDDFYINDKYTKLDELKLSHDDGLNNFTNIYKVEGDWFAVERVDYKTIKITLPKNETGKLREFNFLCYRGNCWTKIFVIQQ